MLCSINVLMVIVGLGNLVEVSHGIPLYLSLSVSAVGTGLFLIFHSIGVWGPGGIQSLSACPNFGVLENKYQSC